MRDVERPKEKYRVRELAEIVRDTVPSCELEFAGDASPHARNYPVRARSVSARQTAQRPGDLNGAAAPTSSWRTTRRSSGPRRSLAGDRGPTSRLVSPTKMTASLLA